MIFSIIITTCSLLIESYRLIRSIFVASIKSLLNQSPSLLIYIYTSHNLSSNNTTPSNHLYDSDVYKKEPVCIYKAQLGLNIIKLSSHNKYIL